MPLDEAAALELHEWLNRRHSLFSVGCGQPRIRGPIALGAIVLVVALVALGIGLLRS